MKTFRTYCKYRELEESWIGDKFRQAKGLFGGMLKKEEDPDFIKGNQLAFNSKEAAEYKKTFGLLKDLFLYPGIPPIEKMPKEKRELAFRTWLHRTEDFQDREKMTKALNLSKNLLSLANGMDWDEAIFNSQIMKNAFESRVKMFTEPEVPETPEEVYPEPKLLEPELRRLRYGDDLSKGGFGDDSPLSKRLQQGEKEIFVLKMLNRGENDKFIIKMIMLRYGIEEKQAKSLLTRVRNKNNKNLK